MSENVGKLVGVVVMAVLVVVGVAVSSGDDTNFTRNAAFVKLGDFQQLPEAEQARLAPAFLEQAAPKSLDTGPINKINSEVGPIAKGATGYKLKDVIVTSLEAGVLEGKGVDGKGGTSSFRAGTGMDGKTGKAGIWLQSGGVDGKGGTSSLILDSRQVGVVSGRKAGIWLQSGGVEGVADRIGQCVGSSFPSVIDNTRASNLIPDPAVTFGAVNSLKDVIVTSYIAEQATDDGHKDWVCSPAGDTLGGEEGEALLPDTTQATRVGKGEAGLLAECMESKVGDVFLKSHIEVSAADCVATVMPAISPKRAKQLGTYWRTQQQLSVWTNGNATSVWTNGNATSVWTNEE